MKNVNKIEKEQVFHFSCDASIFLIELVYGCTYFEKETGLEVFVRIYLFQLVLLYASLGM